MNETNEKESRLSENPIFANIPEEKRAEIARVIQTQVIPARTLVFQQGDPGDSFCMIKSGRVRVFRRDEEGFETDLSELGPGDSFGEMSLLTGEPRSACVEAIEDTCLGVLPKVQFDRILKDYPDVALAFIKQMSDWLHRNDLALEREAKYLFKAPSISWVDFLVIIALTLLCGMIFNVSNPNGIQLIPKFWSDEPVPEEDPSMVIEKYVGGQILIVDARPANFFDQGHIKGAINIPLSVFDILYLMEMGDVDKSKEIIVYGRTISSLYDLQVARKLILRGHKNVKTLQGGLSTWKKNGYPVES